GGAVGGRPRRGAPAVDQVLEDPPDDLVCALLVRLAAGGKVDPLEHERAQREHRLADLLALADVAGALRGLDEVVDERVDAARPGRSEQLDLAARQLGRAEHPCAHGVVDVVVDVGHPVDEAHDLALQRVRLTFAGVGEDAVANLGGQVEASAVALEGVDDPEGMLVVAKAEAGALTQDGVERLLARVAEGRMAEVVAESDRLGQVLVQPQRPRDRTGDAGRLERMREPRPVVIATRVDEDLRLVLESSEGLGVNDAVAVALKRSPEAAFLVVVQASARLVAADRERREPGLLLVSDPRREGVRNSPGELGHVIDSSRSPGRGGTAFRAVSPTPTGGENAPLKSRYRGTRAVSVTRVCRKCDFTRV